MDRKKTLCPFCFEEHSDLIYFGEKLPIFERLEIIGGGYRPSKCPTCRSTDRERLIYIYLVDVFFIFKKSNIKILHVAPENLIYNRLNQLIPKKKYIVGSLHQEQYKFVKDFTKFDLTNCPFEDNTFDLVICNHVLEHIIDEKKALKEIRRVLKPTGQAILQVPIAKQLTETLEKQDYKSEKDRLEYYGQRDHVRLYGQDYINRLKNAGFDVKTYHLHNEYPRFGINEKEILFIAYKASLL